MVIKSGGSMLTLTVEDGQIVELGQPILIGKNKAYIWAINGNQVKVSADAPRDVHGLRRYYALRASKRGG